MKKLIETKIPSKSHSHLRTLNKSRENIRQSADICNPLFKDIKRMRKRLSKNVPKIKITESISFS